MPLVSKQRDGHAWVLASLQFEFRPDFAMCTYNKGVDVYLRV